MKTVQVHQLFVRTTVPSRLGRTSMSLVSVAVFAGCLLAGSLARAQTPALDFTFQDAPGTTTASSGSVAVSLTMFNAAGVATDLHGAVGSGVNGPANGYIAMDFTSAPNYGGANGPYANVISSPALNFGAITKFTVTEWFKEDAYQPPVNGLLGRMFVLGDGAAATDINAANTIGMKWQQPNQWNVSIGTGNPTATAIFASNLPTNTWLFMGIVYDGTNVYIYQGTDTSTAQLISTTSAPGLTETIGTAGTGGLYIGNRNTHQRAFAGWIDQFQFYPNYAGSASFVESIRKSIAPKLPGFSGIYPDGTALMQDTNTFVFTASTINGLNLTNIDLKVNSVDVTSGCTFVTNGTAGTSTNVTVSYLGLPQQRINTAVMSANDSAGVVGSSSVTFDTFATNNFTIKAEEFNYSGGLFIDNPDYTATNGDANSYFMLQGTEGIDVHKGQSTGDNQATDYRYDDGTGTDTQTPLSAGELTWWRFPAGLTDMASNPIQSHMIGNWSSAEWQNYTKTFPAGNYNVYARLTTSSGSTINFDQVTSDPTMPNQTLSRLGQFIYTGSGAFQWVPLLQNGTLAVVNFGGVPTVATVRATTGGGANADFYMLVPANPNLPTISNVYPDGQFLFEPSSTLTFTASSPAGINTANITLTLNGTNVSAGLVFSGGPNTWNVSYTGLKTNQTYATVISVTDNNALSANATLSIDTWNPVLQVEAEDFDFDPAKSIVPSGTGFRYIDNPVPTPPLVPAANSYEGQVGDTFLDEQGNNLNNGLSPIQNAYAGATLSNYRTNDPCATTPVTDAARRQFQGTGALDYNVGFLGPGHWEQYTRTWPSGTFNLYARVASGANLGTLYSSWSQVIAGWGTTNQVTRHIGSFAIPSTGGYSSYFYTPLIDRFGNYAQLTLGGTNTFRDTHLVFNQTETANGAVYGLNINFYMLLDARTDLPRIDNVYPNGFTLMQQTNTLSFVASSPAYGLSQSGIGVTLNGNNISPSLVFSGASPSFNVSYPGLQPNTSYTAVISVTDLVNQVHTTTVNFDTFSPNYYTWEAEDFDYDPSLSPATNNTGLRWIDNPVLTSTTNSSGYYEQTGDGGQVYVPTLTTLPEIDYSASFGNIAPPAGGYAYRTNDVLPIEVTGDAPRQKYLNARLQTVDPYIQDYDILNLTNNGWIDYTRTFPSGNFLVYARLSAGSTLTNFQCAQVVSGAGTTLQVSNILGYFQAPGNAYATWQYAPLLSTNTPGAGSPVVLSLGGVETLQVIGDWNEHVNFFMLVPAVPNLTASISGPNVILSFPTVSGLNYTVQWKNNLTDPAWTPLSTVPGNGTVMSVNDSLSGQNQRFYRLAVP